MKYTKYFGAIRRERGIPHLSQEQDQRYFNIIVVENQLEGLIKAHDSNIEGPRIAVMIMDSTRLLRGLTRDLSPQELLEEMIRLSIE